MIFLSYKEDTPPTSSTMRHFLLKKRLFGDEYSRSLCTSNEFMYREINCIFITKPICIKRHLGIHINIGVGCRCGIVPKT
uniref:Uncharacterized protein n=1 Tax=Lepeophtheirus salmonis TaxID=72036 RepID=A0A0K2UN19_LEPSM